MLIAAAICKVKSIKPKNEDLAYAKLSRTYQEYFNTQLFEFLEKVLW